MQSIGRLRMDLSGYIPSLPTPFDVTDNVDRAAFEHLCDRQIENGAVALVVGETTGEAPTLTPTEHRALIHIAVGAASKRVPIIAGAGSNSTAQAIAMTHDAERLGADAVLSVVPYYNKPSQRGLLAHFKAIQQATSLPIIVHDVPERSACGLLDETLAHLATSPHFIGLMDATGDVTRPARLRHLVGPEFQLLSGHDMTALAFLALGGDGCISVTSNLIPRLCRDMFTTLKHGDVVQAQRLAAPISHLSAALALESNPAPLKYALSLLGLMLPSVRLPLVELASTNRSTISDAVARVALEYPEETLSDMSLMTLDFGRHAMTIGYV